MKRRIFAFTPFAAKDETFAQAITRHMDLLTDNDVAVIMDHDILHTTRDWYPRIAKHVAEGVEFGTCLTNRLYSGFQIDPDAPKFNADEAHWQHGHNRAKQYDGKRTDYTSSEKLMSGHLVVISKKVWNAIQPLQVEEIVGLDNEIHKKAVAAGFQLWLLEDVYVYHRYRFGDRTATEHLDVKPIAVEETPAPTEKKAAPAPAPETDSDASIRKVCYTVITGDYDTLKNPNTVTPGWEYHLYTDNPKHFESFVGPWKVFPLERNEGEDDRALQRRTKLICPIKAKKGQLLRTVYVDGNQQVVGNLDKFVEGTNHKWGGFTLKTHPERTCAYQEADTCIELSKDATERIKKLTTFLRSKKFKKNQGLYETGIMIRDYNDPSGKGQLSRMMIKWEKMLRLYSFRDQISLPYVLQESKKVTVNAVDKEKFDPYFGRGRHQKTQPVKNAAQKTPSAAPRIDTSGNPIPASNPDRPFSKDFELLVYTSAVGEDIAHIPHFVESALRSNPKAHVEILVSDKVAEMPPLEAYNGHVSYHRHHWLRNDGNGHFESYRYIIEPNLKTKYVFMPSIIEQVTANLLDAFLPKMKETGLPFSNIVRPSGIHMPSAHFTEFDAFWPHPFTPHIPAVRRTAPETLLLNIVRNRAGEPIETDRPTVTVRVEDAMSF